MPGKLLGTEKLAPKNDRITEPKRILIRLGRAGMEDFFQLGDCCVKDECFR